MCYLLQKEIDYLTKKEKELLKQKIKSKEKKKIENELKIVRYDLSLIYNFYTM